MALSLLRSGEEVNKINHIRGFGERHPLRVLTFAILKPYKPCLTAWIVKQDG
jgi:hypothetical protein